MKSHIPLYIFLADGSLTKQITVTNPTFPVTGDTLKKVFTISFVSVILIWTIIPGSLNSQAIAHIPLETFGGFTQDSFTLPGNNSAKPVYKYGVYKSKVTTNLDGVGQVYVHHVLSFTEPYSFMEVYSKEPASKLIQGIKRYGNFRMYTRHNYEGDTIYKGPPKVEIVKGLDSIITTIHPLRLFTISQGGEIKTSAAKNNDNSFSFIVKDCNHFVDPILYDSLFQGGSCLFTGWIQYDLETDLLKIDLHAGTGEDFVLRTFESVIYDSEGNLIGHVNGYGPLSYVSLTKNRQYVYTNTGGGVSEDFSAPYIFRIFDLHTGEVIYTRKSVTNRIGGAAITNTNIGVFKVMEGFGETYEKEVYLIHHDKGKVSLLHLYEQCQPPLITYYYPTHCECVEKNGQRVRIYYDAELPSMDINEFFKLK